ncbi:MAG: USH1C-binding protein 1 [Deltaproteobacteria bacterium]|nr:USH1C-binding protein 1 [Deltaproteobacteria bacterium]MBQ7248992.1 USH1C-binding protein 1 [Deltaproteobacteria bacterium]
MSISGVNNTNGPSSISGSDLGVYGTTSLQFMFAKLQLELAEAAKASAMDKMNDIQKSQEERKLVSKYLNECRQAQADAQTSGKATEMSAECVKYMEAHGLAYDKTGNDYKHNKDEWKVAITALEGRLDELGSDTQQQMVYVQDYMGQYNSYLQGSNTQIANGNQTLQALARGQ